MSPAWFVGTGSGAWVRFEGTGIGTRLKFGSRVARPADPVSRANVLSTSGEGAMVGPPGTMAVSKVLVRLTVSTVGFGVGLSEVLSVGAEGLDSEGVFGAGDI